MSFLINDFYLTVVVSYYMVTSCKKLQKVYAWRKSVSIILSLLVIAFFFYIPFVGQSYISLIIITLHHYLVLHYIILHNITLYTNNIMFYFIVSPSITLHYITRYILQVKYYCFNSSDCFTLVEEFRPNCGSRRFYENGRCRLCYHFCGRTG